MERTKQHARILTIALSLLLMLATWATLAQKADAGEAVTMSALAADATGDVYTNNASFTISTKEELIQFAELVNGGKNFTGKTVTLLNDIVLNDTTGMTDMTAWRVEAPAGVERWTPIGKDGSYPFCGTFDGGGHTVSGMYIRDTSTRFCGLFGYNKGTIQGITITKSIIIASVHSGGHMRY